MDKIAKDDTPRHAIKRDLKNVLHAGKVATEIERQLKENRRLQAENSQKVTNGKRYKRERSQKTHTRKGLLLLNIDHIHQRHLTRLINWVQALMPTQMKNRGQKRYIPNIRRQQRQAKSNHLKTRVQIPTKIHRMHY